MKQEALIQFTQSGLTVVAMLIFGLVFVLQAVRTYRQDPKEYEQLSQLPLREDEP